MDHRLDCLAARGLEADHLIGLFRHDDHADRGEQAVNGGNREQIAENSRAKQSHDDLDDARHNANAQRHAISLQPGVLGGKSRCDQFLLEAQHRPGDDHDHPGGRSLDGHLRVAEERADHAAQRRRPDPHDRRILTGAGDRETQRQGDEKHQKTRKHVGLQAALGGGDGAAMVRHWLDLLLRWAEKEFIMNSSLAGIRAGSQIHG